MKRTALAAVAVCLACACSRDVVAPAGTGRVPSLDIWPNAGTWTSRATPTVSRRQVSGAWIGGQFYEVGGADLFGTASAAVQVYTDATDSWGSAHAAPVALSGHTTVNIGGRLYVFGGATPHPNLGAMYRYTPGTDHWDPVANLPDDRYSVAGASVGGKLYIFGGYVNSGGIVWKSDIWRYDPVADAWDSVGVMPAGKAEGQAVASGGLIYVMSGNSNGAHDGSLYVFNPADSSCVALASGPDGYGAAVGVIAGKIYDIDGSYSGTYDGYDPLLDAWTAVRTPPFAVRQGAYGVYQGRLYIFGGTIVNALSAHTMVFTPAGTGEHTPAVTIAGGAQHVLVQEMYQLSGSFGDPEGSPWSATVDYGDGGGEEPLTLTGTNFVLGHGYSSPGEYTVTVRVTDHTARTGLATRRVFVEAASWGAAQLIGQVRDAVTSGHMPPADSSQLINLGRAARQRLVAGDGGGALIKLNLFTTRIADLYTNAHINQATHDALATYAGKVETAIP